MSTRAWVEYYVVERSTRRVSLAMQFYRWAYAEPAHAAADVRELMRLTREQDGAIPVGLVRELLEENVHDAVRWLPESFPIGCYFFLLQRAVEETDRLWPVWRKSGMAEEERPDRILSNEVDEAMKAKGIATRSCGDPIIDRAHFSIGVGRFARRWEESSACMTFLRWLQYITQATAEIDFGSVAGQYEKARESYTHRVFFHVDHVARDTQPIDAIELEVCSGGGRSLGEQLRAVLADAEDEEDRETWLQQHAEAIRALENGPFRLTSLAEVLRDHELVSSAFWESRVPRGGYLGP